MMKLVLTILVLVLFGVAIQAQNSETKNKNVLYKNSLKIRPLNNIIGGEYGLTYERVIKPKRSLNIYGDISFNDIKSSNNEKRGNGFDSQLGVDVLFYLSKNKIAPIGWYAGTGPIFTYSRVELDNNEFNFLLIGARAITGYQWIIIKRINLGIEGGLRYDKNLTSGANLNNLGMILNISLGYSWL